MGRTGPAANLGVQQSGTCSGQASGSSSEHLTYSHPVSELPGVTYTAPSPPSLLVHGAQYPSRSESHTMRYWPIGHAAVEQSLQVLPKRNLPISQVGLSTSDLRPESFSSGKAPRAQRDLGAQ